MTDLTTRPAFTIRNQAMADWAMNLLARASQQSARIDAERGVAIDEVRRAADQMIADMEAAAARDGARDRRTVEVMTRHLMVWHRERLTARMIDAGIDPSDMDSVETRGRWDHLSERSVTLSAGEITAAIHQAGFKLTDQSAFMGWALTQIDLPAWLKVTPLTSKFPDTWSRVETPDDDGTAVVVDLETGEQIPGVRWAPAWVAYRVKVTADGEQPAWLPAPEGVEWMTAHDPFGDSDVLDALDRQ